MMHQQRCVESAANRDGTHTGMLCAVEQLHQLRSSSNLIDDLLVRVLAGWQADQWWIERDGDLVLHRKRRAQSAQLPIQHHSARVALDRFTHVSCNKLYTSHMPSIPVSLALQHGSVDDNVTHTHNTYPQEKRHRC
jgi:hypothetical protein